MKGELVVKDNAFINASYNLELAEQRLILLSIVKARETGKGITSNSRLEVHASDYMAEFNVDRNAAYEVLKKAVDNLFNRYFSYKEQRDDGTESVIKSRWVSEVGYTDKHGKLHIIFAPAVVPLITRLEQHFTSYQLKQVSQLTSKYAIRIYEMLIAWRSVGKCYFDLNDFRHSLGIAVDEYKQMGHFKSRVLDPAIKQINELTDINVKYEQTKSGRIITGFRFQLKIKYDLEATQSVFKLTTKQIATYAHKLAHDSQFASKYAQIGEDYNQFEKRIEEMLQSRSLELQDDLKRIGFRNKV